MLRDQIPRQSGQMSWAWSLWAILEKARLSRREKLPDRESRRWYCWASLQDHKRRKPSCWPLERVNIWLSVEAAVLSVRDMADEYLVDSVEGHRAVSLVQVITIG